jgi:pimeloyl-ACP methyl ester carboxylesterase
MACALLFNDTVVSAFAPVERRSRDPSGVNPPVTVQPISLPTFVAEPRHAFRDIDGVRLHWAEYGDADARAPVVLLHGLNDSYLTWSRIAPLLSRGRRVLALDLPGHGLSDRPDASYELAWYASIVARWIDSLDAPPIDLVGHSLGGGIALALLAECRPSVRRLVLAAPGGLGREVSFVLRLASIPGVVEHFGQPFMSLGTRLALSGWRQKLPDQHIAELCAMNATRGSARAFARTVRDLIDWRGQRHSFIQHVHEVKDLPPIAILWGDGDTIIPIAHGRALVEGIDGVRFVELVGCGHHLHHDDPLAFTQGVRDAVDAISWPTMRVRIVAQAKPRIAAWFGDPESVRTG